MTRIRLDDLKAVLEQRRPPAAKSEAEYKRALVADINRLPGGRARRIEDRYAIGVLDMIIKPPALPLVLAEGKLINGNLFAPTGTQFKEGKKWEAAGVECLLIGWKGSRMYVTAWCDEADLRHCFTIPGLSDALALIEYLR